MFCLIKCISMYYLWGRCLLVSGYPTPTDNTARPQWYEHLHLGAYLLHCLILLATRQQHVCMCVYGCVHLHVCMWMGVCALSCYTPYNIFVHIRLIYIILIPHFIPIPISEPIHWILLHNSQVGFQYMHYKRVKTPKYMHFANSLSGPKCPMR